MQVLQLKDHLQQRGLPVNGRKDELIKRLKEEEKCGTVAHDKGNGAPAIRSGILLPLAQPAASKKPTSTSAATAASSSANGDTTKTPFTVKKVRKATNSLHLIFVPTSPFGAVHVFNE